MQISISNSIQSSKSGGGGASNLPVAYAVSFSGVMTEGELQSSSYQYIDPNDNAQSGTSFIWYKADNSNGLNKTSLATTENYTLLGSDEGKFISFEVTPKNDQGVVGLPKSTSYKEMPIPVPLAQGVSYSGELFSGELLTGTYTYVENGSSPEGVTTFKWYRSDNIGGTSGVVEILGATSETYTLQSADENKHISFQVTPVTNDGSPVSGDPVNTDYKGSIGGIPLATNVSYSGTTEVGEIQTGIFTYNGAIEGVNTFIWYRSDNSVGATKVAISGATSQNYTLHNDDFGKLIFFQVIPVSSTGTQGLAVVSSDRGVITEDVPVATNVVYTGDLQVDSVLTGDYDYSGPAEGSSVFAWYTATDDSGTGQAVINGADSITYTLLATDEGKFISFQVTPKTVNGTSGVSVISPYQTIVEPLISTFNFSVNTAESGTSNDDQFTLTVGSGTFLYDLTTSDGHSETGLTGNHTITFSSSGIYSISISGQFPAFQFNNGNDGEKMATLDNFGVYGGGSTSQSNAFRGCDNMILNATDSGNFGSVASFQKFMFTPNITGTSLPLIDTSSATRFDHAFRQTRIPNFPANLFDNCAATDFNLAFYDTILSEQSIDNILVSLDAAGQSGGTFYQSGGSAPSSIGIAAANSLADPNGKQWTITYTGQ